MTTKTLYMDDSVLPDSVDNVEIVRRFGKRRITHVFHDIDGTHSLIRDWVPVMSLTLHTVIANGLPDGYDSDENIDKLVKIVSRQTYEETNRFCIESAGLSALTQMEWAIRRAIESFSIPAKQLDLDAACRRINSEIVKRIWAGEELFDHAGESEKFVIFLKEHTPRLFRMYERILNGACRDANMAEAAKAPEKFRVKGSLEFMKHLHGLGAINYFITGAVIDYTECGKPTGGIYDEVCSIGFEVGSGKAVEAVYGSTWDKKIPKDEVMKKLCREENINPSAVLIIGDGRSEIAAGAGMSSVTVSRLPEDATQQRELHRQLGTNLIISDYCSQVLANLFYQK